MPAPPLSTARASSDRARISDRNARVFICDDDLGFASELASALTLCGFDVRTLRDGGNPIEIFELFKPAVVFLDIFMPPPDGFEVMNHIGSDTRRTNLSLALMSGADDGLLEVARRFCQARGIRTAGILRKPVRLNQIIDICKNHLREAEADQPS